MASDENSVPPLTPPASGRGIDDLTKAEHAVEPLLAERLARAITLSGPISVAQFMAAANAHYYATRDPFGVSGDFVTAPEISQMFGELIGLWAADLWSRAGKPEIAWVELGPGRGTLTQDALRAMGKAGLTPPVHFVETSPVLRQAQADRVPGATWHDNLTTLSSDRPLLVIANEFFDALPIHQIIKGPDAWRERLVACQDVLFLPVGGKPVPDEVIPETLRDSAPGTILETSPACTSLMADLAIRLAAQGGAALIVDYGYEGPATGETLQAVKGHAFANPFDAPGEHDLTAHVDLATLAMAARLQRTVAHGPVDQGTFLRALGIAERADALARAHPEKAAQIAADATRLAMTMADSFKALAITAPEWPTPAGFA